MNAVKLTILNSMGGFDFEQSLDQHTAWGIGYLDLKDGIFGKSIADLTPGDAARVSELASQRRLETYCLSTVLLHSDVEAGEAQFREYLKTLDRILVTARVLKPKVIRLLSAGTRRRTELTDAIPYLQAEHPWLFDVYREAADRIAAAGFVAMIENECGPNIFSTPAEVMDFFTILNRPSARLIWDIANMWQVRTFPTVDVYKMLRPYIGSVHLKGGQCESPGGPLAFRSAIEDASWPVAEIIRQVLKDGIAPVICLNSPHGSARPGYDYSDLVYRDIAYMRRQFPEIQ